MNLVEGVLSRSDGDVAVSFGGHTLTVDPALVDERPGLQRYVDRRVIVGVRPEELEDAALEPDAPADRRLKTTVDLREDMGSELLIHFSIDAPPVITDDIKELAVERGEVEDPGTLDNPSGNASFVAAFDADSAAREGDRIEVLVDTRSLHFFDPETRSAIWDG
jgi:multiple sugar transport system ATP-binding protein